MLFVRKQLFCLMFYLISFCYVAAIIELFHLLPPAAGKFLDELVSLTMQLEAALPQVHVYSQLNSPYRLPLTKFLNRYATDSVDYFLARLSQPSYFRRWPCVELLFRLHLYACARIV